VLKYANRDKALSREILSEIPLRYWDKKTLRGIWRMAWS